jgi:hypothetical protein
MLLLSSVLYEREVALKPVEYILKRTGYLVVLTFSASTAAPALFFGAMSLLSIQDVRLTGINLILVFVFLGLGSAGFGLLKRLKTPVLSYPTAVLTVRRSLTFVAMGALTITGALVFQRMMPYQAALWAALLFIPLFSSLIFTSLFDIIYVLIRQEVDPAPQEPGLLSQGRWR